jgi:hypothetical protein
VDTHTKLYNYKPLKECNNIPALYRLKGERENGKKPVSPV